MAYDQNSTYEPPRRAYMNQTPQSNPAYSNGYNNYAQDSYNQYGQDNGQGYQQQGRGNDYDYDQRGQYRQEPAYDDRQNGGYVGGQQQGNGQYYREDEGRNYDPRYQPRAQRGPPPQQRQPPPPGPRGGQPISGRDQYQPDPRAPPRQNGRPPQQAMRARDPYDQQDGYATQTQGYSDQYQQQNDYAPQGQGYNGQYQQQNAYQNTPAPRPREQQDRYEQHNGSRNAPQSARIDPPAQRAPESRPSKASIDEWKAQEKAKFKQASMSPETQNFDNAFPVFGKKAQRDSNRSGGTSTPNGRPSEETSGRPSTSHDRRPQTSRENSYRTQGSVQPPPPRPDIDRQYSSESTTSRPRTAPSQRQDAFHRVQADQRDYHHNATTPVREDFPESWPMVAGQTPPKVVPERRSPPRVNGHDPRFVSNTRGPPAQQAYTQPNPNQYLEPQTSPRQRGLPNMQPIDTSQASQQQRAGYEEHPPFSPAVIPPRPSTSQGGRPTPRQQLVSPVSQHPQSAIPQDSFNLPVQTQKPWEEPQTRHASLGDIYDDYNTTPPRKLERAPTTRDEEIEAEMPDFDSAAPGQTSSMHKRVQTMDKHLANGSATVSPAPPMPRMQTAPPPSMPQSQSAHDLRYTDRQYGASPSPAPNFGPPRRVMTDHPRAAPMPPSAPERQYDIPYRNSPAPDLAFDQGGPLPPPQVPYATEPQVRRSMDDGRTMPMRPGPAPGTRILPNGQPTRGPLPPQQRPGFDRNQTNQTVWSDPGLARTGSVPPPRGPPEILNGDQQRAGEQARHSHPDALPHHPTPVRAGHILPQANAQPSKPPPVRNYAAANGAPDAPHQRQASVDAFAQPVTHLEIERLRGSVDNGQSGPKNHLLLVKKLVEASTVLAGTTEAGGRADPKTTAKNRDRYLNEAYKRLKKLVAGGYPSAQFYMADCYGQGMLGLEPDTKEAFKLYQAAAKAGHPQAAYRTAVCCEMGPEEGGGTSRDYPKAVQWYRRAATLGDNAAMYKLGAILLKGLLGQQRNIGEAVTWLKRGAERADKDHPHALHELATLYESSNKNPEVRNKVIADDAYAKDLYMQAAKLGYKFSQFKLGQAYEYGSLGLPISNRDSIAWYTKAAAQGEHQAELALSGWYLTGAPGILEHSDTEAYLWARKAASSEGGPQVGKAMFAMGYFTENGIGCPASMEEARKWYGRAASYKFPKAVERLEELKRSGGKGGSRPAPVNGKLTRKDQKRDEENCVVM